MQYRLLVQNPRPEIFTAAVLEMPDCAAQGRTEDEAVAAVRAALEQRLSVSKIITLEVNANGSRPSSNLLLEGENPAANDDKPQSNPWLEEFGRFRDDPTYDDFLAEMAAYRRELDVAEGV